MPLLLLVHVVMYFYFQFFLRIFNQVTYNLVLGTLTGSYFLFSLVFSIEQLWTYSSCVLIIPAILKATGERVSLRRKKIIKIKHNDIQRRLET